MKGWHKMSKLKFESKELEKLASAYNDNALYLELVKMLNDGTISKKAWSDYTGTGYGTLEKVLYSPLQFYPQFIPSEIIIKGIVFSIVNGSNQTPDKIRLVDIETSKPKIEWKPVKGESYNLSKDKKLSTTDYIAEWIDENRQQVLFVPVDHNQQARLMTFESASNLKPVSHDNIEVESEDNSK